MSMNPMSWGGVDWFVAFCMLVVVACVGNCGTAFYRVNKAPRCEGDKHQWVLECMKHSSGTDCAFRSYDLFGCKP